MEPVVAHVNYQLQPVIVFDGSNWPTFQSAFVNYARQQGFFDMLGAGGEQGTRREPGDVASQDGACHDVSHFGLAYGQDARAMAL
jgi:hypothetical protein